VITDTNSGKLYIGSASGKSEGIWQRWNNYANPENATGGNKKFKEIHENLGINISNRISNTQY
jgi:hypothetical protein